MLNEDAAIAEAAQFCLDQNLSLPLGRVDVQVRHGWLTLSGCLDWDFQVEAAEHGMMLIPGAQGLTNAITVKSSSGNGRQMAYAGASDSRLSW